MVIHPRPYQWYKGLNALFTGLIAGAIFTLYAPLSPETFSLGGIALALGSMAMAYGYTRWMHIRAYRRFLLLSEGVMAIAILLFLLFAHRTWTPLMIYVMYQISFVLGGYLVRAETLLISSTSLIASLDRIKQYGYLTGLALAYGFYRLLSMLHITQPWDQMYALHIVLLPLEGMILSAVVWSFGADRSRHPYTEHCPH